MKFTQIVPPDTNYDFIGKFKFFSTISFFIVAALLFMIATRGLNFGIDFTGGTLVQARFKHATTAEAVRAIVSNLGETGSSVVAIGSDGKEFLITVRTIRETTDQMPLNKRLIDKIGKDDIEIVQTDIVGPKVGAELKQAAILSLFYSLILIMIYIWFRFDLKFAPGATMALVHDLIFVAGFYVVTGREFTIAAVAALLTTAGYSVNDTIVIYDRVRETIKQGGEGMPLKDVLNRSINATLSRTLLTSGLTAVAIIPIIIFCKGELANFAQAMMVGVITGTYSTMYIAAPFTITFQKILDKSNQKKNRHSSRSRKSATVKS